MYILAQTFGLWYIARLLSDAYLQAKRATEERTPRMPRRDTQRAEQNMMRPRPQSPAPTQGPDKACLRAIWAFYGPCFWGGCGFVCAGTSFDKHAALLEVVGT